MRSIITVRASALREIGSKLTSVLCERLGVYSVARYGRETRYVRNAYEVVCASK